MVLFGVLGCAPEFDPIPTTQSPLTFGEKFFTVACERVAYTSSRRAHALNPDLPVDVSGTHYRQACRHGTSLLPADAASRDPKVATLLEYRGEMVDAVNLIFPGAELSDLQDYMVSILPLTDDGSFPDVVRKGAGVIEALEQDTELHWGLARLDGRIGYRPHDVCLGLMRELLRYDKLHPTLNTLLGLVAQGGKGHQAFVDLVQALSLELRTTRKIHDPTRSDPQHPGTADRTLRLALDLLFTENAGFGSGSMLMVRRDWRGLSKVRGTPLPAPFIDTNTDGLADIDSTFSTFATSPSNAPVPPPFVWDKSQPDPAAGRDAQGRALDKSGQPIYEYVNLDRTLLAALSRDAAAIMDPVKHTGTRLLMGLTALMGDRVPRQKQGAGAEVLSYQGFDTARAPLLDLLYAVLQMARDPGIDDTLDATVRLLKLHEAEISRVLGGALAAKDLSKKPIYNGAQMDPRSNYFDDLVLVLQKVVNKDGGKLMEDLLGSLADPRTRNLGVMFANYLRYSDVHELDQNTLKVKNPVFKTPVNRSLPDTGANRSIQARLLHIITNTNGMKMCNKEGAKIKLPVIPITLAGPFKECELFEIPNGALFYTQSIARLRDSSGKLTSTPKGNLRLKTENMPSLLAAIIQSVGEDTILQMLSGIDGMSSHPTTEALNRLMFMNPLPSVLADVQDPAVDIDGHTVNTYHVGSLLSWEVPHPGLSCSANDPCQFYEALRPVVQAFADHDAEQLFLDLLTVTHRHWATRQSKTYQFVAPNKPDYASGGSISTYEPLMADVLTQTDLFHGLNALSPRLNALTLSDGRPARKALVQTLAFLVDPARSTGLTYRDGQTQSKTTDGSTTVQVSPFYLLADAWAAKRAALARMATKDKEVADAWTSSTSDLVDIFLTVEGTGSVSRFHNRRLVPAAEVLVGFLRGRIAAHRKDASIVSWLGQALPLALEEKLDSPVVARLSDFLRIVEQDTATVTAIYDLIDHLIDELDNNPSFRASITGIADMVQLLLDDTDIIPVVHAMGLALSLEQGLIEAALRFLKPAIASDQKQNLSRVLRNAYQEQSPGKSPVQTLLDLATELHRLRPGTHTPYAGPDFQEALRQGREFLVDQETGLAKFFEIVKSRCGGPCNTSN